MNFAGQFKIFQNKKLGGKKQFQNKYRNTETPNEITNLVNESKWLLKPLSEKLMEGKKLKESFVMDRSSRQQLNLLINLNIIKRKVTRNYVVLM